VKEIILGGAGVPMMRNCESQADLWCDSSFILEVGVTNKPPESGTGGEIEE